LRTNIGSIIYIYIIYIYTLEELSKITQTRQLLADHKVFDNRIR